MLKPRTTSPDTQGPAGLRESYERFLTSIQELLTDVTTLEVNSVLARNISADHPLIDVDFLQQIGEDLWDWLTDHATQGGGQQPLSQESLTYLKNLQERLKTVHFPLDDMAISWIAALRQDCTDCLHFTSEQLPKAEASQRAEYRRFLRYLQKFLVLCDNHLWYGVDMHPRRERQQLRKLWELVGTTCVYAQTVVGLDSDVISRLNEQLLQQGLSREQIEALMRFHSHNTEASARSRDSLLSIMMTILRAILRR